MQLINRILGNMLGREVAISPALVLGVLLIPTAMGFALGPYLGWRYAARQFRGTSQHKEAKVIRTARGMTFTCAVAGLCLGVCILILLALMGV